MYSFDIENNKELVSRLNAILNFNRNIVGIKFIFAEDVFNSLEINQLNEKMPYCKMVIKASDGETIKANFDNFGCFGGARALGIVNIDSFYESGRFYEARGLYKDLATSHYVTNNIERIAQNLYGLLIGPLQNFESEPDVIVMINEPYQIMRLVQGYANQFGICQNLKMAGNQAMCAEITAHPYNHLDMNLSMSCMGARRSGIKDTELLFGIIYGKFEGLVKGVERTVTPVETVSKKDEITNKLERKSIRNIAVIKGTNYNKPFYNRDFPYFSEKRKNEKREYEKSFKNIYDEKGQEE